MEAVLAGRATAAQTTRVRPLANWILCWIVLPNFSFSLLWFVGGPTRAFEVILIGIVGIVTHRAPFAIRFGAFVALLAYALSSFISALFNLSLESLFYSLRFAGELRPSSSPEYVVCAAALVLTVLAGWQRLRYPTVLARPVLILVAAVLTFGAAALDYGMTSGTRGSYKRIAPQGADFESATRESGLDQLATGERHVLLVVVEAMGLPRDAQLRSRLIDIWAPRQVREAYDVTVGETPFYGSTTGGEMRELCGRWGDYYEVLDRKDADCLPARLARRGYETQAWHGFDAGFFERDRWYPNIGFDEIRFKKALAGEGSAPCPGVFAGACDREIPAWIAAELKSSREPQFLYWLTLNSHLPVISNDDLGTADCARFDQALDAASPMICRLFLLFDQSGRALAREITASNFPPTDILIVGDHIPPFFDRANRQQFAPDRVPWILLRPKKRGAEIREMPQPS